MGDQTANRKAEASDKLINSVSILIASRNRADELEKTLESILLTKVSENFSIQLLVVDNGSSDCTPVLLQKMRARLENRFNTLLLQEPRAGKARALNVAVGQATGAVLLFTDDDVRVPSNWIEPMTVPILTNECDAVAGGIRLAAYLKRDWMRDIHLNYLACTTRPKNGANHPTVGANCAIKTEIVKKMGCFDPEVGPGAIGHAEDLFLWLKMQAHGCRIRENLDLEVEHHPSPDRLTREAFKKMAKKNGDWLAYVDYHWSHTPRRFARLAVLRSWAKLWGARLRHLPEWLSHPCTPEWELPLLEQQRFRSQYLDEKRSGRKYARAAAVKNCATP